MGIRRNARAWRGDLERLERRDLLAIVLTAKGITAATQAGFGGAVATFLDTNLLDTPSDFNTPPGSVQINWGDGQTTSGQVVGTLVPGLFEVEGTHTYAQAGTFSTGVSVSSQAGQAGSGSGTAVVTAPPLTSGGSKITGTAGQPINNATVATFLDPVTSDVASDFQALIRWGDGNTSPGTIRGGNGVFTVSGSHTYGAAGTYATSVALVGVGGRGLSANIPGQAVIGSVTAFSATPRTFTVVPGVPFTVVVASFTDSNAAAATSTPTAVINWGDGNLTAGVVTPDAAGGGRYIVTGSYRYASTIQTGVLPVTVTISDASGQTVVAMSKAAVVNAGAGPAFSGGLAPESDTSPTHQGGFTNTNRPTFSGAAPPFALVQLTARRIDVDAPIPLGQAVTAATGRWTLPAGPLADGIYYVTAVVTPPGGYPGPITPIANKGQLVIDTSPPRVVAVTPIGGTGQVLVTLRGGQSGLALLGLLSPANYLFSGRRGVRVHPVAVTRAVKGQQAAETQSVVLTLGVPTRGRRQLHDLTISGSGISDNAGNPLEGDFHAALPATGGRGALGAGGSLARRQPRRRRV